jgi:hypothetical protein
MLLLFADMLHTVDRNKLARFHGHRLQQLLTHPAQVLDIVASATDGLANNLYGAGLVGFVDNIGDRWFIAAVAYYSDQSARAHGGHHGP